MTTFISGESPGDLIGYAGLVSAIGKWLERTDIADRIPDFIRLAEARFRRVIRTPEREAALTIGLTGSTPLPTDFDSVRLLTVPGAIPRPNVSEVTPAEFYSRTRYAGEPNVFTTVGGQILLAPTPSSAVSALLIYYGNIPALTASNGSNWLFAANPDLYLFGALVQAEFYGWNDERLPLIKSALDEMLQEISQRGMRKRFGSSPLVARAAMAEARRGVYRR